MLLIPKLYLKHGEVVKPEITITPLFASDPLRCSQNLKEAGVDALLVVDLEVQASGKSPHADLLRTIQEQFDLSLFVSGNIRSLEALKHYIEAGVDLVILGSLAYQHPELVEEACRLFPNRIATHVDVRGEKVVIPGWTVANKTPLEYAERFREAGVKVLVYSDVENDGQMREKNATHFEKFCRSVRSRILLNFDPADANDLERLVSLTLPRFEGIILEKSFYDGRIDLHAAKTLLENILFEHQGERTITEE